MSPAKFDEYSTSYHDVLDTAVGISGEGSEYFAEYKACYVARLVGKDFAGKILDYGCGVGLLSAFLNRKLQRAIVHGFDVSAASIEKIPADLAANGQFSAELSSLRCDYDLAVISNVMHHVPFAERQLVINDVAGRLANGGLLLVFEHNPLNPLTQWVVKHCPFDDDAVLLRPREATKYFSIAGLAVHRRDYVVFFPRMLSFLRPLEPMLRWLPAGAQYALVGEKHGQ